MTKFIAGFLTIFFGVPLTLLVLIVTKGVFDLTVVPVVQEIINQSFEGKLVTFLIIGAIVNGLVCAFKKPKAKRRNLKKSLNREGNLR